MQLQTIIDIPQAEMKIPADSKVLLLGSCFADEVGEKFTHAGFDTLVNPFGTIYNPVSIAALLLASLSQIPYTADSKEFFKDSGGVWHSWMHHSRFSSSSRDELIESINAATARTGDYLRTANVLIVTLGTAIVYNLADRGWLVANCHKQPDRLFKRKRLAVTEIADLWTSIILTLQSINPHLHIILNVSPIRHKRDGIHVNQISKGILLNAVDTVVERVKGCDYFPSYEIMLDELRDYRFYADDMIHPSPLAVEYIWQRFQDTYFDSKVRDIVAKRTKEWKRSQHRPIVS